MGFKPCQRTRRQLFCDTAIVATFVLLGERAASAANDLTAADATSSAIAFIQDMVGRTSIPSDRLALRMPADFPTGYTVPMEIVVDSPMTADDHVKSVRVFAPENPLVEVAAFHFVPARSLPRISSRIRLAGPQDVIAIADMSDGSLLLATAHVSVASNGCE